MDMKMTFSIQTYPEYKKTYNSFIFTKKNYPGIGGLRQAHLSFTTAQRARQAVERH
jgi:hypothetical protein